MFKRILALVFLLVISACAYTIDSSVQDVKFVTPGASGAVCTVMVDKVKYVVNPPQTVNLFKSRKTLEVDCQAPGNRRRKLFIEPGIEDSSALNLATGGAGYAWDYASGALWRYPDVIEVNFEGAPLEDSSLPAQNNPDVRQPEGYLLEEFSPEVPRMNSDRNDKPAEIIRRQVPSAASDVSSDNGAAAFTESSGSVKDKGDLVNVPLAPARDVSLAPMGPQAPASVAQPADKAPAPLFPGQ